MKVDQLNNENDKYSRASLDDYELGRLIGYGCSAAVYEARVRQTSSLSSLRKTYLTFSSNFTINANDNNNENNIEIISRQSSNGLCSSEDGLNELNDEQRLNELAIQEVRYRASIDINNTLNNDILPAGKFNLAIKILCGHGSQLNSDALEKAMEREQLLLRKCSNHPNIVRTYFCFVDRFPLLNDANEYYSMGMPANLSADGYGSSKTLFIVMRRYDLTLPEYLRINRPTYHERLILFAQLLEGLLYLKHKSIVHRDLKSDNLLISSSTSELVIADFDCALYQPPDLIVHYTTDEFCKGGNLALMAPEIVICQPGPKSYLDYNKADLWASGTLCYEFFSQPNPFFHGSLRQETYNDQQLPILSPLAPPIIEKLVHCILCKNPQERPSISRATDCFHLYLWFKSSVLKMNKKEFHQTYTWNALETLFNKRKLSYVERNLKTFFYQRQTSQSLYNAQAYLKTFSTKIIQE